MNNYIDMIIFSSPILRRSICVELCDTQDFFPNLTSATTKSICEQSSKIRADVTSKVTFQDYTYALLSDRANCPIYRRC